MAEVTLIGLWRDVRHRWILAVAIAAATVLGGYLYAQSLPNVYRARVVVAFAPKANSSIGGDTLRVILPKYAAFITAPATTLLLERDVKGAPGSLADSVSASIQPDSGNLEVSVERRSPDEAAVVANAAADELVRFARSDTLLDAVVVAPALPDATIA